jgi:TRAP-type C4-dicarboxylate transport system permease small subunit
MSAAIGGIVLLLAVIRATLVRKRSLEGLFRFLGRLEVGAAALLLGALIALGGLQILLRNVFHGGILWADPVMRHAVLWIGCLGASIATCRLQHITIDVFTRLLPQPLRLFRHAVVHVATAAAAFFLGLAALGLVADERAFGEIAFGTIRTWTLQSILPFAFLLITYRSLVNLLTGAGDRRAGSATEGAEQ